MSRSLAPFQHLLPPQWTPHCVHNGHVKTNLIQARGALFFWTQSDASIAMQQQTFAGCGIYNFRHVALARTCKSASTVKYNAIATYTRTPESMRQVVLVTLAPQSNRFIGSYVSRDFEGTVVRTCNRRVLACLPAMLTRTACRRGWNRSPNKLVTVLPL